MTKPIYDYHQEIEDSYYTSLTGSLRPNPAGAAALLISGTVMYKDEAKVHAFLDMLGLEIYRAGEYRWFVAGDLFEADTRPLLSENTVRVYSLEGVYDKDAFIINFSIRETNKFVNFNFFK